MKKILLWKIIAIVFSVFSLFVVTKSIENGYIYLQYNKVEGVENFVDFKIDNEKDVSDLEQKLLENKDFIAVYNVDETLYFGDVEAYLKPKVSAKCTNLNDLTEIKYSKTGCSLKYPTNLTFRKMNATDFLSVKAVLVTNIPQNYYSESITPSEIRAKAMAQFEPIDFLIQIAGYIIAGSLILICLLYIQISSSKKLFLIYFQNGYSFSEITSKTYIFQIVIGILAIAFSIVFESFITSFLLLFTGFIGLYLVFSIVIEYAFFKSLERKMDLYNLGFGTKTLYFAIRIFRIFCFYALIGASITFLVSTISVETTKNNTQYNEYYKDYYYVSGSAYSGLDQQSPLQNPTAAFEKIDQTKMDAFIVSIAMSGGIGDEQSGVSYRTTKNAYEYQCKITNGTCEITDLTGMIETSLKNAYISVYETESQIFGQLYVKAQNIDEAVRKYEYYFETELPEKTLIVKNVWEETQSLITFFSSMRNEALQSIVTLLLIYIILVVVEFYLFIEKHKKTLQIKYYNGYSELNRNFNWIFAIFFDNLLMIGLYVFLNSQTSINYQQLILVCTVLLFINALIVYKVKGVIDEN
ncbi:MAG: hypothetical protein ACRCUP_00355 [Mycoplasmatales bacterium]